MITQILSVFAGSIGVAIILNVPLMQIPFAALTSAVGWTFKVLVSSSGYSSMMATFAGALALTLFAHILARIRKAPVTVYLIPAIVPLAPGSAIYHAVYCLIENDSATASTYLVETLQIAAAIAVAVFLVDSFVKLVYTYVFRDDEIIT